MFPAVTTTINSTPESSSTIAPPTIDQYPSSSTSIQASSPSSASNSLKNLAIGLGLGLGIPCLAAICFFCCSYRKISISIKVRGPEPPPPYVPRHPVELDSIEPVYPAPVDNDVVVKVNKEKLFKTRDYSETSHSHEIEVKKPRWPSTVQL
jgi:hypothetical protein